MIRIPDIEGRAYGVLGLGKSGLATAAALLASGARVAVWDDNEARRAEARHYYDVVDFTGADLAGFDALVLSPGIPHTHPRPHDAVAKFRAAGVPVIGDIELLFRAQPYATYIGVTGTNGKSTTTALIGHVLQAAGKNVEVGGNLGTPVLSFAPLGEAGIYVLELSSYQLELIERNLISTAVLLNITPDHLARHGGIAGYVAAKQRIIRADTPQTLIIGADEAETQSLIRQVAGYPHLKIFPLSVTHRVPNGIEAGWGALTVNGHKVLDFAQLPRLPGRHNAQNIGAAFAACRSAGLSDAAIMRGMASFPGLAHRQQLVAEIGGVRFVNDSKATNADAAEKALLCYDNIYWIIGGQPKEGGLAGLEAYAPRIRHAFLIGEASGAFAAWCAKNAISHTLCGTLEKAAAAAARQAAQDKIAGSVVLLSPACASWDQFKSFEERGDTFVSYVQALEKA